jgi:hypothetical protein
MFDAKRLKIVLTTDRVINRNKKHNYNHIKIAKKDGSREEIYLHNLPPSVNTPMQSSGVLTVGLYP